MRSMRYQTSSSYPVAEFWAVRQIAKSGNLRVDWELTR